MDVWCPGLRAELQEKKAEKWAGMRGDSFASLEDFFFLLGVTPKLPVWNYLLIKKKSRITFGD